MVANKYEAMMVYSVTGGEEAVNALTEKFKALVAENGTLENVDEWGKRKLAYLINDEAEGYYVLMTFESDVNLITELKRVAGITDGILRRLITKA